MNMKDDSAPTLLDMLLHAHAERHRLGTADAASCDKAEKEVRAEIHRLTPELSIASLDRLIWLSEDGIEKLSDVWHGVARLYWIAHIGEAGALANAILDLMHQSYLDALYVQQCLEKEDVIAADLLVFLNDVEGAGDLSPWWDAHALSNCAFSPEGRDGPEVESLRREMQALLNAEGVTHDGIYRADALYALDGIATQVVCTLRDAAICATYLKGKDFAATTVAFVKAVFAAGAEGADLTEKYKAKGVAFFHIGKNERAEKARRITLLPLEYIAEHGDLEGMNSTEIVNFVNTYQRQHDPVEEVLAALGIPPEIIPTLLRK